eukprot:1138602-Pelagomonas_calceolata.AAC.1
MERADLGIGTSEQHMFFILHVIRITDITDRRSCIGPSSLFNSESLRNPNRNNNVTAKAKSLAFKLSCHAIQRFTTIVNARHVLHFQGTSRGGVAGHVAVESRRRRFRASGSMVNNPPDFC